MDPHKVFEKYEEDSESIKEIISCITKDEDLIKNYKSALEEMPKNAEEWTIDPHDERVSRVDYAILSVDRKIRSIKPSISNSDALKARSLFAEYVLALIQKKSK